MSTQIWWMPALQQHSINMKNFSVVSPRLPAINTEMVYYLNTPNYSDASFIYVSRYSLCKLLCIFRSKCPWSCNIWFDILASWTVRQQIHQIHLLRLHRLTPSLQYDKYFLFSTNWWKHIKSSNLHVPRCKPSIESVELHSHCRFDELFTRLTMEPFAEKLIDNVASISFCTYRVRGEWRRVWECVTQIQCNSSRSRNWRNRESPEAAKIVTVEKLQKSYAITSAQRMRRG